MALTLAAAQSTTHQRVRPQLTPATPPAPTGVRLGPAGRHAAIDDDGLVNDDEPAPQAREAFTATPDAIPRARHWVTAGLAAWGLRGAGGVLELAVGEVFTNAVRYGKAPIEVVMAMRPGRVRVEVHDRGGGRPAVRQVHRSGPGIGGWGLRMVDELVDAWGSHVSDGHTVVWVEQAIPGAGGRARDGG